LISRSKKDKQVCLFELDAFILVSKRHWDRLSVGVFGRTNPEATGRGLRDRGTPMNEGLGIWAALEKLKSADQVGARS
jgi:hypothetical protein